jgi:hypothetical protein
MILEVYFIIVIRELFQLFKGKLDPADFFLYSIAFEKEVVLEEIH